MNEPRNPPLCIVGASIRAAAMSARRAGFSPAGIDLFADWDTARCCAVQRIAAPDYPVGLARRLPHRNTPWMYTGALENHPDLLDQLASIGPLWGNGPEVVRKVRDPFLVAEVLADAAIPHPRVRSLAEGPTTDAHWLIKPLRGAGGAGIRRVDAANAPNATPASGSTGQQYLQQIIEGIPCSAVYVAASGRATLMGVSRQLVGEAFLHAKEFTYCGSVGPMPLANETHDRFLRLGDVLASHFDLAGIFGVDSVLKGDVPFPVEINPRWTASVEVLEYSLGASGVGMHAEACRGRLPCLPGSGKSGESKENRETMRHHKAALPCVGKAILYADKERVTPERDQWAEVFSLLVDTQLGAAPALADVPYGGQRIRLGRPMISLLVTGRSPEDCVKQLRRQSQVAYGMFAPVRPSGP